jgi:hypothetical protein
MRVTISVLATSVLSAFMANAGMYGEPVVNLDAKTFKKVMATEHAAVSAVTMTESSIHWRSRMFHIHAGWSRF